MSQENQQELLPAGRFAARAHSWDLGATNGGAEQIAVSFKLIEPGFEGRFIGWYGMFSDTQIEFTVKALRACGWRGVDLTDMTGMGDNEVSLVVEHEEYKDKVYARVKWVNAGGGVLLKKVLDPNAKKAFAQRMRSVIAGVDMSLGTRPAAAPAAGSTQRQAAPAASRQPNPPPHGDDDIPF